MTRASSIAGGTVLGVLAGAAHAGVEVGGIAGVHVFSVKNELGVYDAPNADSERDAPLFGVRVGYYFTDHLGVELDVGVIPSEGRQVVFDVWNVTYRAQVVYQFREANPAHKVLPFAFVGGGVMNIVASDNRDDIGGHCTNDNDPGVPFRINCLDGDLEAYVGGGVKYRLDRGWGLRGDLYVLFPPASDGHGTTPVWFDGHLGDFELLLSVYKELGCRPGSSGR